MLLHARALATEGLDVDLIGAGGAALPSFISDNPRIAVHTIPDATSRHDGAGGRFAYVLRALMRGARLLTTLTRLLLWRLRRPDLMLVQNPPGVPTMAVAWVCSRLRSARFAVDWHNLTSAMLALRLGPRHALVAWIERYEAMFGRAADVNLCVSSHMAAMLGRRFAIRATVFLDRPAEIFAPLSSDERQRVRGDLFARFATKTAREPALLISPTSWTADEKLEWLLEALGQYDLRAQQAYSGGGLPPVVALITGSGPLKLAFEERLAHTPLTLVSIRTAWFEPDEYPRAVAAADLGMCFHTSASGVDLPMKIADMFGAGIPVCAYDYGPCLQEIVRPGVNGVLFSTPDECRGHLETLLRGFPESTASLDRLRRGVIETAKSTWAQGWRADARAPLLE